MASASSGFADRVLPGVRRERRAAGAVEPGGSHRLLRRLVAEDSSESLVALQDLAARCRTVESREIALEEKPIVGDRLPRDFLFGPAGLRTRNGRPPGFELVRAASDADEPRAPVESGAECGETDQVSGPHPSERLRLVVDERQRRRRRIAVNLDVVEDFFVG